ncbi:unnamed protein product [Prunus armeniaca]
MGIGKYRGYRQNIGNIAFIGDISSIQGKICPYPPVSVSTVENTDISTDISVYRPIFQSLVIGKLQTAKKGGDSIKQFLLRLKHIRDQLCAADVLISNDDFIFRAQLLAAEQTSKARIVHHWSMCATNSSSSVQPSSVASSQGLLPTPSQSLPSMHSSRGFSSGHGKFNGGQNQQSQFL